MLDQNNGWGITKNAILKTADGGVQWRDVTPAHTLAGGYAKAKGDCLSTHVAWSASAKETASTEDGALVDMIFNGVLRYKPGGGAVFTLWLPLSQPSPTRVTVPDGERAAVTRP